MQQFAQKKRKELSAESLAQLSVLKDAIDKIFQTKYSNLSFEELYRNAYTLVRDRNGDVLYEEVKKAIARNLTEMLRQAKFVSEASLMLAAVKDVWSKFTTYVSVTNDILMYMDRNYIPRNHLPTIPQLGCQVFKDLALVQTELLDKLHKAMISEIMRDRDGELVEKRNVKEIALMLCKVGSNTYEDFFEKQFLEQTSQYYSVEVQRTLAELSCPEYIKLAEERLLQEALRSEQFLDKSTAPKLRALLLSIFLEKPAKTLIAMESSGLDKMLQHERLEDIGRMYGLFAQDSECKQLLLNTLVQCVKREGEELMKASEQTEKGSSGKFVDALIAMKEKYNKVWSESCRKDKEFELPFKQTFDSFLNVNNSASKALAVYCDEIMREKVRHLDDRELDELLDKIILVFRHIQSKDMFDEFYAYYLSRRLLMKKCMSDDAERLMISKLKAECGNQFTIKLETMMKDINNSQEILYIFHNTHRSASCINKLEVRVLTQGNWPIESKAANCNLPIELNDLRNEFTDFYMGRHSGRVLNWKLNLGEAELRARVGRGYEFVTTTFQAVVLMLFNDCEELTLKDIIQKTRIPVGELKKNLTVLLIFKVLINMEGNGVSKEIRESDKFRVNESFASKFNRVRLPLMSDKPGTGKAEQLQRLESTVEEDRGMLLDATIAKIMKVRKRMEHNELIADVVKMTKVRFAAEPPAIKQRIESLIEKEILERSKQDRRIYIYKA